jgi:DNA repair exonuclease SbcCD nuclease subunit
MKSRIRSRWYRANEKPLESSQETSTQQAPFGEIDLSQQDSLKDDLSNAKPLAGLPARIVTTEISDKTTLRTRKLRSKGVKANAKIKRIANIARNINKIIETKTAKITQAKQNAERMPTKISSEVQKAKTFMQKTNLRNRSPD